MMKIAVCVKEVRDYDSVPASDWKGTENGELDLSFASRALGCFDETALELALRLQDEEKGEIYVVTAGTAGRLINGLYALGIRKIVAAEDDEGIHPGQTAGLLAKVLEELKPDVILCGSQTGAGDSGLTPYLLAENLKLPCITQVTEISAITREEGDLLELVHYTDCGKVRKVIKGGAVLVVGTAPDCSLRMATMKERMKVKGKKAEIFENRDGRNQEKGGERQGETEGPVRIFREDLNKKCRMVQTSPKEAAAILRDFIQDDNWAQSHEKELKP